MMTNIYKKQILELLQKRHLLTISEINNIIPDADYSTVFRNIEQLLKDNEIKKVMINNKLTAYESIKDNHDHFICNGCGGVESISLLISQRDLNNKTVSDITVRGACAKCKES